LSGGLLDRRDHGVHLGGGGGSDGDQAGVARDAMPTDQVGPLVVIRRVPTRPGITWSPLVGLAGVLVYQLLLITAGTIVRGGGPSRAIPRHVLGGARRSDNLRSASASWVTR
jgi:hypothetical protein